MARKPAGSSRLQITLHWGVVALIDTLLVLNNGMQRAFTNQMNGQPGNDGIGAALHFVLGIVALVLAAVRLAGRLTPGAPPPVADHPGLVTWSGMLNHLALDRMMFAMALSGIIAWFRFDAAAAQLPEYGCIVLSC